MKRPIWTLLRSFTILKLFQLGIIYFTSSQFDTSSQLIIESLESPYNAIVTEILNKLITWDSVYFNDLFVNDIAYEHQFVFCPGWIQLIRFLSPSNYYQAQLSSIILSNVFHFESCVLLYYLTYAIFKNKRMSYISGLMMIISPAGVFLTTNYSENLSNLLTLASLYIYYQAVDFQDITTRSNKSIKSITLYVISGILIALNYTIRANGLLLGILYIFDLYDFFIIDNNRKMSLVTIFTGMILFVTFVAQNIVHYLTFCPARKGWCTYTIPCLFTFAQGHYWNNGFLAYWTVNNTFNFVLAMPIIVWNFVSIKQISLILPQYKKLTSLVVLSLLMIFSGLLFWNVQILNRVTSFNPLIYWCLAINFDHYWMDYVLGYIICWNLIQTGLFAAFLPPA